MKTLFPIIFIGIWLVLAAYIIWGLFSKRGRNSMASRMLGGATIIQDYGELSDNIIQMGDQKLRVLKCEKDGEQFLALEVRDVRKAVLAVGLQVTYVRIDKQLLDSLDSFLR